MIPPQMLGADSQLFYSMFMCQPAGSIEPHNMIYNTVSPRASPGKNSTDSDLGTTGLATLPR